MAETYDISKLSAKDVFCIAAREGYLPSAKERALYEAALDQKDPQAQADLSSHIWGHSRGLPEPWESYKNAKYLAEQSAASGNLSGQFMSAFFEAVENDTFGFTPTPETAAKMKSLVDQGCFKASVQFGTWLIEGRGVEQDIDQGIQVWIDALRVLPGASADEQSEELAYIVGRVGLHFKEDMDDGLVCRPLPPPLTLEQCAPLFRALRDYPNLTQVLDGKDTRNRALKFIGMVTISDFQTGQLSAVSKPDGYRFN